MRDPGDRRDRGIRGSGVFVGGEQLGCVEAIARLVVPLSMP